MLMTKLNGLCVFLAFFGWVCVFNCDIKVLNGKHANNHLIHVYICNDFCIFFNSNFELQNK